MRRIAMLMTALFLAAAGTGCATDNAAEKDANKAAKDVDKAGKDAADAVDDDDGK
jgi:hypothetical protein